MLSVWPDWTLDKECPNKSSPPGPRPVCKEGHWKRDCPRLQRERKTGAHFSAQEWETGSGMMGPEAGLAPFESE